MISNNNNQVTQSYSELEKECLRIRNEIQKLEIELNHLKFNKANFSTVLDRLATKHIEMSLLKQRAEAQSLIFEACT